jgi:hypothetical protein
MKQIRKRKAASIDIDTASLLSVFRLLNSFFASSKRQLLTQAKSLDDSTVALDVTIIEIIEESTTLTYKLSQRTSCNEVLVVLLYVLC